MSIIIVIIVTIVEYVSNDWLFESILEYGIGSWSVPVVDAGYLCV